MKINRRDFFKFSMGSLLITTSPITLSSKIHSQTILAPLKDQIFKRLSFLAYKTTTIEGDWELTNIEGQLPNNIHGRFLKIGPGTKNLFGTNFNHFFDGDAYITQFSIRPDKVSLKTLFLETPERLEEQKARKMLYHEFGTRSPEKNNKGRKNQPNINLMAWNNSLLALSEGGHPIEIDRENFTVKSLFNFNGSLPAKVSFTAHPKFDPQTNEGFAFGIYQGLSKALKIFKINPDTQKLTELYSLNQKHVYMIHDMLITKNHILFVIPPAFYQIKDIILDKVPMSQTMMFDRNQKTRILVVSRDGRKKPMEFTLAPRLVFHNGNCHEENGILTLQTFMTDNESLLTHINQWASDEVVKAEAPSMFEIRLDLKNGQIISEEKILKAHDFPVFNEKFIGIRNQYLYSASMGNNQDPMAFDGLTKFDLFNYSSTFYPMKENEMCGEPFFISNKNDLEEDDGYLGYLGYNQFKDESFLEILNAKDMTFLARVWAGRYLPLGFHGHFYPN